MDTLTLSFRGKEYKTLVLENTTTYPHFYWCYFVDEQLKGKLGCITFKSDGKEVNSVNFVSKPYHPLLESLKLSLKKYIEQKHHKGKR